MSRLPGRRTGADGCARSDLKFSSVVLNRPVTFPNLKKRYPNSCFVIRDETKHVINENYRTDKRTGRLDASDAITKLFKFRIRRYFFSIYGFLGFHSVSSQPGSRIAVFFLNWLAIICIIL